MSSLMDFLHAAERLKTEVRHSHKSNGEHETVAEHSWRLCLMTMLLAGSMEGVNQSRCLKMAIIHDLPEAFAGDAYRLDVAAQAGRHDREEASLSRLTALIPAEAAAEITGLWEEFEEGKTSEARLVGLIDRLEVLIQHNESDIGQWDELEKRIQYGLAEKHADRFGWLKELALEIDEETGRKLVVGGLNPQKVSVETYQRYYGV